MIRAALVALSIFSTSAHSADAQLKLDIMKCESGLEHHNNCGDGGKSCGIAQFQQATFDDFVKMSKQDGTWPATWKARRSSAMHQEFLLDWGLNNGFGDRWRTCYRRALKLKKGRK